MLIPLWLILGVVTAIVVGCLGAIAGQLYERRRREQWLLERVNEIGSRDDSRMERLEQAVDAIAVELERVGEGQRFVSKLFADRSRMPTPPSPQPGAVRAVRPPTA